jgi:cholesterol transport system auxiliary component
MKRVLPVLVLALTGCVNMDIGRDTPAATHYVLEDARAEPVGKASAIDGRTLLVLDTVTTSFYDTDNLAFSRAPGTRGHYQFARWTERPGKRFADLLRARLEAQGGFGTIATAGGHVRGGLLLDTELTEFYHDAQTEPGSVQVVLRAELVDLKNRSLLGRKLFERRVEVASYDAAGAADGFNHAVSGVIDDLTAWLDTLKK